MILYYDKLNYHIVRKIDIQNSIVRYKRFTSEESEYLSDELFDRKYKECKSNELHAFLTYVFLKNDQDNYEFLTMFCDVYSAEYPDYPHENNDRYYYKTNNTNVEEVISDVLNFLNN